MRTHDCYTVLSSLHSRQAVVCHLGSNTKEWHRINGENDTSFHMHSMGMASSFGLGLALALPQTPVWILDSDGGVCINLGSVLTEAQFEPPNLVHFIVSNRRYVTIDGPSVVNYQKTDYAAIIRGAGVKNVHEFHEFSDFEREIPDIVNKGEHAFVVLEVEAEMEVRPQVPYEGPEIKYRFARHMEKQEGIRVLGPLGY